MAKPSLIEIVQEIANDLDTDEVNSIGDTTESLQIANIVASTYKAIMSNRNWPHTLRLVRMNSSADSSKPNIMTFDEQIKELVSVYYNKQKFFDTRLRYEKVKYIEPDDMLRVFYSRNTDDVNTLTIDGGDGQVFIIKNNVAPTYFTSFDDNTLVFDSFDADVDDILKSSKTQVRAYVTPEFELRDDFVPDLPEEAFTFLIEEAKSKSAIKIAQKQDPKAEQESKRQNQWLSRKNWRVAGGIKYVRFGRKRSGISSDASDPTFKQGKE
jgi:hypothetical protein